MKQAFLEFWDHLIHFRKDKLVVEVTENSFTQFFRVIFVGGTATAVDIGSGWLFFRFVFLHNWTLGGFTLTRDVLAAAVGFLLGLVVNYVLSVLWVFVRKDINRVKEFLSFAVIGLVGLLIKSGCMMLLGLVIPQQNGGLFLLKSFIGTMIAFVWNFTARKVFIYNRVPERSQT